MKAILTNNVTGERVKVHATTNHPSSSYGIPVWVDDTNTAYLQVGVETLQSFYSISDVDDMKEWQKYAPKPIVTKQDISQRIGDRIRQLRTQRNLTLQELADAAGSSAKSISRIENGQQDLTITLANKLLNAMGYELSVTEK